MSKENIREMAVATLYDIWGCIDWDKVGGRRAFGIWDEFSSKVKASALTTSSYEQFVEKLARKMGVRSLRYKGIQIIQKKDERTKSEVLKLIREETLQVVLKVRLNTEARKELNEKIKKEGSLI